MTCKIKRLLFLAVFFFANLFSFGATAENDLRVVVGTFPEPNTGMHEIKAFDLENNILAGVSRVAKLDSIVTSPDRETFFAVDTKAGRITLHDGADARVLRSMDVPELRNTEIERIAVAPDNSNLYIANGRNDEFLIAVDTGLQSVKAIINLDPAMDNVSGIAVSPDSLRVYVAGYVGRAPKEISRVLTIDTSSMSVVSTVDFVATNAGGATDLALTPDGGTVWVTTRGGVVGLIDTATNKVRSQIRLPGRSFRIVLTPDGQKAYATVASESSNPGRIAVLDVAQERVISTIDVPGPLDLALSPAGDRLFVTNQKNILPLGSAIIEIDTLSDRIVADYLPDQSFISRGLAVTGSASGLGLRLESVSPATGLSAGGFEVELKGREFSLGTRAFFGLEEAQVVSVNSTRSMTVLAPRNAVGKVDVLVRNGFNETSLLKDAFEYVLSEEPIVTGVTPNSGLIDGGEVVVISGAGFGENPTVFFGGAGADVTGVAGDAITVVTPAQTSEGQVQVVVRDESGREATGTYEYTRLGSPLIRDILPNVISTAGGEEVTLLGEFFSPNLSLSYEWDGESLTLEPRFDNSSQVRFIAPSFISGDGCASIDVTVRLTNPSQESDTAILTYEPSQVVTVIEGGSIQKALDNTAPGACILVENGRFVENIVIDPEPVTLMATNPQAPYQHVLWAADTERPTVRFEGNRETGTRLKGFAVVLGNGGIEVDDSTPRLENLLVQNNARDGGDGGGIAILNGSAPILDHIDVRTNSVVDGNGAGIFVGPDTLAQFRTNIELVRNQVEGDGDGGGLYLSGGLDTSLSGVEIRANVAGKNGGGIFVEGGSILTISSSLINENVTMEEGGGIHISSTAKDRQEVSPSELRLIDTSVDGNRAVGNGGGIHIGIQGAFSMQGGSVSRNATEGRGVGLFLDEDTLTNVDSATFEANSGLAATSFGGAIYAGDFATGVISDSRIIGNLAHQGGAAFLDRKTGVDFVNNPEIRDNRVRQLPSEDEEPDPVFGPALLSNDSESNFLGNVIRDNVAEGPTQETAGLHLVDPFLVPEIIDNVIENNDNVDILCFPDRSEVLLSGNSTSSDIVGCEDVSTDFR